MKEIFEKIIKENSWSRGRTESPCGPGSSIKYTENLRLHFPLLVEKFNIKSILDAPCGDFNWMKLVVPTLDVDYTGADIVSVLIAFAFNSKSKGKSKRKLQTNLSILYGPYGPNIRNLFFKSFTSSRLCRPLCTPNSVIVVSLSSP